MVLISAAVFFQKNISLFSFMSLNNETYILRADRGSTKGAKITKIALIYLI